MKAIPRQSKASATTHQALWGMPNNSSSHTVVSTEEEILANKGNYCNTGVCSKSKNYLIN